MVRFLGRDLANNKKIKYALTAIYGIGLSRAKEILDKAGLENVDQDGLRTKDLSDEDISNLRNNCINCGVCFRFCVFVCLTSYFGI